jgi:PPOX class probable F420-dependent enzyme
MASFPASHRDLLDTRFGTLATIGPDGLPQLTVVGFLYEEPVLRLSLNTSRQKTKNLQARPECSLLIVEPGNPFRYLEVRGRAHIEPDDDLAFADRIGAKYGGDVREHDRPGDRHIVATIDPAKVYAVDISP